MGNNKKTDQELQIIIQDLKKEVSDLKKIVSRKEHVEKELSIVYDALASSINGIIITDVNGTIEYVNKAFLDMFEYRDRPEVIGKSAADIFVEKKISQFSDIENTINQTEGNTSEFSVFRGDGSIFPVEVSTSIVTDTAGKIVGKMASFIDISDRRLIEEENRRLYSRLIKSLEIERQRVAKDLHDGVGQTLMAAKLNFIAYQREPEKYRDRFQIGIQFIDDVSREIREVCNDLYPAILRDHGLESTIKWYSKNHLQLNNIITDMNISLKGKIKHELEINLYRIIKEIFTNIVKHSKADRVSLNLYHDKKSICLKIEDNGVGFTPDAAEITQKGFGISNIRHRVKEMGGSMEIVSGGKGTSILIEIRNE